MVERGGRGRNEWGEREWGGGVREREKVYVRNRLCQVITYR